MKNFHAREDPKIYHEKLIIHCIIESEYQYFIILWNFKFRTWIFTLGDKHELNC